MTAEESRDNIKIRKIDGYLHKITPIVDGTGRVINHVISPFSVELKPRDILQILVGASILSIPVGLTEETWTLAASLPLIKINAIMVLSLLFIALFVYFNYYRFYLKGRFFEYLKRVIATYVLSFAVVGVFLTLIEKCPWGIDNILAYKRIIITAFPASMSATISDTLK
jgi:uncharacterized membrane protein